MRTGGQIAILLGVVVLTAAATFAGWRFYAGGPNAPRDPGGAEHGQINSDPIAICRARASEESKDRQQIEQAYAACGQAAQRTPDDRDTLYLLGISALQLEHGDVALTNFRKAARLGHCRANYYLGQDAWNAAHDATAAEKYYLAGRTCGDERAAKQLFSAEVFASSAYPKYIAALYNQDVGSLNSIRFHAAAYVVGLYTALGDRQVVKDACWSTTHFAGGDILADLHEAESGDPPTLMGWIYEKAIPLAYAQITNDPTLRSFEDLRDSARNAGRADLIRLVEAYDCKGLTPYKIVRGIRAFARAKKPLHEIYTGSLSPLG